MEAVIYVCMVFTIITRIADALDFPLPNAKQVAWSSRILLKMGYRGASVPG